jgi:hypothetical protein
VAFWKVFGVHAAVRAVPVTRGWLAADDRAIGRTLGGAILVATVVTAVLMLPPLRMVIRSADDGRAYLPLTGGELGWLLLYAIPQALTVGIAIGVPIGILWGMRGRQLSTRSRGAVAGLAFVSALGVWFPQNTLMPGANQAFRQLIARQSVGHRIVLARGANELSLSELSARIDAANRTGQTADLPALRQSFHMRWVVSVAPLVLGLFAIGVCSGVRTARKSLAIGSAVQIGYIWFYVGINPSAYWSATSRVPPFAVAWSPNVIVTLLAILLLLRSRGSATSGYPCQSSSKSG